MGVDNSLSVLTRQGFATVESDPAGSRAKLARLTARGLEAQTRHQRRLEQVERAWSERYGAAPVGALRDSLAALGAKPGAGAPALLAGVQPHAEGWRASLPALETLAHYPMVSHRGGFPDGS
jgi:hypothetical protein